MGLPDPRSSRMKVEIRANGILQVFISDPVGRVQVAAMEQIKEAIGKGQKVAVSMDAGDAAIVISVDA